jgi:hypothetical protein
MYVLIYTLALAGLIFCISIGVVVWLGRSWD